VVPHVRPPDMPHRTRGYVRGSLPKPPRYGYGGYVLSACAATACDPQLWRLSWAVRPFVLTPWAQNPKVPASHFRYQHPSAQAINISRPRATSWCCRTISGVAYDEELADRIRELVDDESDLTEKKMFGGLAFLIGGNMAVAASSRGGVLVRVDSAQSDTLCATTNARPMEMRGRKMQGWLLVPPEDVRTRRQLAKWVKRGTSYARSLPPKR
jgi:TfoX/Sxy family transcriptional regulator of competence genes